MAVRGSGQRSVSRSRAALPSLIIVATKIAEFLAELLRPVVVLRSTMEEAGQSIDREEPRRNRSGGPCRTVPEGPEGRLAQRAPPAK